jgi:hypothetical protein
MPSSSGLPTMPQSFGRDGDFPIYAKRRFRLLRCIRLWSHSIDPGSDDIEVIPINPVAPLLPADNSPTKVFFRFPQRLYDWKYISGNPTC